VSNAADGRVEGGPSVLGRAFAILAVLAASVLAFLLLFGGNGGYSYGLLFQTGGQLVPGNEVLVGGRPVGSVDSIELTEDSQARVEITTDEPLPEGTRAAIRATSLSGIANRYVSLQPGPGPGNLDEGSVITAGRTVTPVDLDQLFDVFKKREREALSQVIKGQGTVYAGRGEEANRTYKFLNPSFSQTTELFAELNRDELVLRRFLTQGSQALGAIADRRDDLSSLVANADTALGAIATENQSLDRALAALPDTLRQANTTFVNLRSTLDDLDPLVADAKPATKDLAPFLRKTRPVLRKANPVFGDLADVLKPNGLQQILSDLPDVNKRAKKTVPNAIEALDAYQPVLEFTRPFTPDLMGFITKFGQVTAYYDGNGHYARATPAGANVFNYNAGTERLEPTYFQPELQYDFYKNTPGALGTFLRCPGAATQQNAGWPAPEDHPFLDDGNLGAGDCDPSDVPPGAPAGP
jgi:phospholipid/cholesterol/gamma-HCH transport system substrate-binding protein